MHRVIRSVIIAALLSASAIAQGQAQSQAAEGLITLASAYDAKTTMSRFESIVKKKGMHIFARIDHAAGAATVGMSMRPTSLLIFGNPKGGTPLMLCAQTAGIDLPLKALVWQDEAGKVWLSYNDPAYIASRHGIKECGEVVQNMSKALAGFAGAAVK